MLTDSHFHPFDLRDRFPAWEDEFRSLGIIGLASAHSLPEHRYHAALKAAGRSLLLGFGIHPQLPRREEEGILAELARSGGIDAIGECGFDRFSEDYRLTSAEQEERFSFQVELALETGLPLVIHLRKAMEDVFRWAPRLSKASAVVFHSWPGSLREGLSLLDKGLNAYFSFGGTVLNGRKSSRDSAAALPSDRILTETDAPYQAPRLEPPSGFSPEGRVCRPVHLLAIVREVASLRGLGEGECIGLVEANFRRALGLPPVGCATLRSLSRE